MSDTKDKILQVLNDNYMVNLFSAQAREHIASKIVQNLDGNYNANPAPEGTVAIDPNSVKVTKKSKKEKVTEKVEVSKVTSKKPAGRVVKKQPKPNLKNEGSSRSLRNLKK